MRLEAMWVHGLRRFGGNKPHKLRLDGKLVCIIGANEVGKSTLLEALKMSRRPERRTSEEDGSELIGVDELLLSRGEDIPRDRELVRVRYRLEEADRDALAQQTSAEQLTDVHWVQRTLKVSGAVATEVQPPPVRDKKPRHALAEKLKDALASEHWLDGDEAIDTAADPNAVASALEQLSGNAYSLAPRTRTTLEGLAEFIEENPEGQLNDWFRERSARRQLPEAIRETLEIEAIPHPIQQALGALLPRIPQFVVFDKEERGVGDEYDLADRDLPEPLLNLAQLAGLDLDRLHDKIVAGETGTVSDLIDDANARLAERFGAWNQKPPVTVSFDHSGTRLFVHVRSGSGPSMRLGERSDGLRQFVALVALTAQQAHSVPPILLIDEVEMHLHYDAQADLVGVLSEQETAPQVIYTTHSAACLPEDLGSAVRVVEGVGDRTASTVRQAFWQDDVGLGTLLMAMGAASLALVLLRPAALVEGGGDLVLLPSLIQEAIGADTIGFQVVPGGAEVARERVTGLDLHGTATIWIYDGDQGGQDARKLLLDEKVAPGRIFLLKNSRGPLELEDLVHPETYVAAVNAYAADIGLQDTFTLADLPKAPCARPEAVETWFKKRKGQAPSKVAIANKVLDFRGERLLVDPRRRQTLIKLHRDATAVFEADAVRRAAS